MERRSFFKFLALTPAAAASTIVAADKPSPVIHNELKRWLTTDSGLMYHEYVLDWTGWKWGVESGYIAAQWLAYPYIYIGGVSEAKHDPSRPFLYSSVPGGRGAYLPGAVFDIGVKTDEGQFSIYDRHSEQSKESAKQYGLKRMMELIDYQDWTGLTPADKRWYALAE